MNDFIMLHSIDNSECYIRICEIILICMESTPPYTSIILRNGTSILVKENVVKVINIILKEYNEIASY